MFAPYPPNVEWYYVIQAELDNGTEVELFNNEGTPIQLANLVSFHSGLFRWEATYPFTWNKPNPFWKSYKNHRWFKYYENGLNNHP